MPGPPPPSMSLQPPLPPVPCNTPTPVSPKSPCPLPSHYDFPIAPPLPSLSLCVPPKPLCTLQSPMLLYLHNLPLSLPKAPYPQPCPCVLQSPVSPIRPPKSPHPPFLPVQRFISEDRLPHLLLYGPPGTGKTSTILACARQLYREREFSSMVLEVRGGSWGWGGALSFGTPRPHHRFHPRS